MIATVADDGDHLPEVPRLAFGDKLIKQHGADPSADAVVANIDAVLDGVTVSGPRPVSARISVAKDFAPTFGDKIWVTAGQNILAPVRHFFRRGWLDLE